MWVQHLSFYCCHGWQQHGGHFVVVKWYATDTVMLGTGVAVDAAGCLLHGRCYCVETLGLFYHNGIAAEGVCCVS
jgi:hypothetical protein